LQEFIIIDVFYPFIPPYIVPPPFPLVHPLNDVSVISILPLYMEGNIAGPTV
jgi:hypothetical protein